MWSYCALQVSLAVQVLQAVIRPLTFNGLSFLLFSYMLIDRSVYKNNKAYGSLHTLPYIEFNSKSTISNVSLRRISVEATHIRQRRKTCWPLGSLWLFSWSWTEPGQPGMKAEARGRNRPRWPRPQGRPLPTLSPHIPSRWGPGAPGLSDHIFVYLRQTIHIKWLERWKRCR